jgi:hypothetical protein
MNIPVDCTRRDAVEEQLVLEFVPSITMTIKVTGLIQLFVQRGTDDVLEKVQVGDRLVMELRND